MRFPRQPLEGARDVGCNTCLGPLSCPLELTTPTGHNDCIRLPSGPLEEATPTFHNALTWFPDWLVETTMKAALHT
jgi:hypothetical protein